MEKCNNYQFLANNMTDENMAKCLSAVFAFEVAQNNKPVTPCRQSYKVSV